MEGPVEYTYQLDEGLVEFGTAVNDSDFNRAVTFLENIGDKPGVKAMWHNLAIIALQEGNLWVTQRCYAALGDASKAFYLLAIIEESNRFEESNPTLNPKVRTMLALFSSDVRTAERIYLEQGDIDAALDMYKNLNMWDEAINLAESRGCMSILQLKEQRMNYLLNSGQEERVGQVLESQGHFEKAINFFLKAQKPAKAARLVLKHSHLMDNQPLMNNITQGLVAAGKSKNLFMLPNFIFLL